MSSVVNFPENYTDIGQRTRELLTIKVENPKWALYNICVRSFFFKYKNSMTFHVNHILLFKTFLYMTAKKLGEILTIKYKWRSGITKLQDRHPAI